MPRTMPKQPTLHIQVRVTPAEKAILQKRAAELGLTVSAYIRMKLIHEKPEAKP